MRSVPEEAAQRLSRRACPRRKRGTHGADPAEINSFTSADRKAADAGFTLLEVVVALAIAGLALVGLFQAGSGGLFAADTAARAEEAAQRAQSHLAAIGRDAALVAGETAGDDGGGYRWRLRVQPAATRPAGAPDNPSAASVTLYDVEVAVSWHARGRDRAVVLKTRRLGASTGGG